MSNQKSLRACVYCCVIVFLFTTLTEATTRRVPSQYSTIQGAINAANMGDEILVAPGTYNGAINFIGKAIWLHSSGGAGLTTINGQNAYHVVKCISGEVYNTILEGFTITGGKANGTADLDIYGGGMIIQGSSPTVRNCVFSNNFAYQGGAE